MINIFDKYNQETRDLHGSLLASGCYNTTVVLQESGFLPSNVITPYGYYINLYKGKSERPRFFNQVPRPEYWEIRGTNKEGGIYNENIRVANIVYAHHFELKRIVSRVEWLDKRGMIRSVDFYGITGWCFAQTNYNSDHQATMTTYYNKDQEEIIVENHETKNVILNLNDKIMVFKSKIEFVMYFMSNFIKHDDTFLYNSLAAPFLVSYNLKQSGKDILVWQEDLPDNGDLPGNMMTLLNTESKKSIVLFQKMRDYIRILKKYPQFKDRFEYIGNIYPIVEHQREKLSDALILTNSDQIEKLNQLVSSLPNLNFHIAAHTEMSEKLLAFGHSENVMLYPQVSDAQVEILRNKCAIYLDINHGSEVESAVREAFLNNQLIISFTQTNHNSTYTMTSNQFSSESLENIVKYINHLTTNKAFFEHSIIEQQQFSDQSNTGRFISALNNSFLLGNER